MPFDFTPIKKKKCLFVFPVLSVHPGCPSPISVPLHGLRGFWFPSGSSLNHDQHRENKRSVHLTLCMRLCQNSHIILHFCDVSRTTQQSTDTSVVVASVVCVCVCGGGGGGGGGLSRPCVPSNMDRLRVSCSVL